MEIVTDSRQRDPECQDDQTELEERSGNLQSSKDNIDISPGNN